MLFNNTIKLFLPPFVYWSFTSVIRFLLQFVKGKQITHGAVKCDTRLDFHSYEKLGVSTSSWELSPSAARMLYQKLVPSSGKCHL